MSAAYLLDTCALLWFLDAPEELSAKARHVIANENDVYVSPVNAWEIQVKCGLGKLALAYEPRFWWETEIRERKLTELPLQSQAVFMLLGLPDFHKDPFDRMLICQALYHGLTLITPDPLIRRYAVPTIWD